MLKKRNQKGFTLIEIIAVLVILGILAAVAIPKFLDLQQDARAKAVDGALAALQSSATMEWSKGLLNGTYGSNNGPTATSILVGDFGGNYTAGPNITVTVANGPTGWNDLPSGYPVSKSFVLY